MTINEDIAKILFEEAKKLMFNSNEYNSLREKYDISIKNIKQYIDDYISRNFNLVDDEIKIYKRTYRSFILFASPNRMHLHLINYSPLMKKKMNLKDEV